MKRCRECNELKPIDDFYRAAGSRDGHRNECKQCNLTRRKRWYERNAAKDIDRVQAWRDENQERYADYQRRYKGRPGYAAELREGHLRRKYGMTQAQYELRLREQGGGCAVCGRAPKPGKSLHIDHDHETGHVRGLLCFKCNAALGQLDDDLERIERALTYVATKRRVAGLRQR